MKIRHLELISGLYLAIPCLLFVATWLKPSAAVVLSALIVIGLSLDIKRSQDSLQSPVPPIDGLELGWTILLSILVTLMSGIGGWGVQYWDYYKHNAILAFLIENPWPVHFSLGNLGGVYLVHSLAYYLGPAAVGKLVGWQAANMAAFFIGVIGVSLSLLWFRVLVGKRSLWIPILFLLAGGLDFLGAFIRSGSFPAFNGDPEWWSYPWQYSAHSTLLFFVPHHALSAWIVTGMLLSRWVYKEDTSSVLFWLAIGFSWSSFLLLGWLPFTVWMLIKSRARMLWSIQNILCAVPLLAVIGLYYNARGIPQQHGWVWEPHQPVRFAWSYLVFILMEFGLYAALSAMEELDRNPRLKGCWWIAIGMLCLLPFYRVGTYNDLVMRASIPSLFVLWIGVGKTLFRDVPFMEKSSMALLVSLGSLVGFIHFSDGLIALDRRSMYSLKGKDNFMLTPEGRNYFGDEGSYFFRHVAKR